MKHKQNNYLLAIKVRKCPLSSDMVSFMHTFINTVTVVAFNFHSVRGADVGVCTEWCNVST